VDALNKNAILEAVERAKPDVIIHQLTALPSRFDVRRFDEQFAMTNRLRVEATDYLLAAGHAVKCRRFIAQSYAGWPYERSGGWIKTEEDRLVSAPEPAFRESLRAIVHLESSVLGEHGIEGFVLRYGSFYGPGTALGAGGTFLEDIRRRRMPLVGDGSGYWSFLHIDDAAAATFAAVSARIPGLYNVVDDEPAPVSEWLPYLSKALGAKPPIHLPAWLARILIGRHGVAMMTQVRGASNRKAKGLLGWELKWPRWRDGFRNGLGSEIQEAQSRSAQPVEERSLR